MEKIEIAIVKIYESKTATVSYDKVSVDEEIGFLSTFKMVPQTNEEEAHILYTLEKGLRAPQTCVLEAIKEAADYFGALLFNLGMATTEIFNNVKEIK